MGLRIDGAALLCALQELGSIGALPDGGVRRLAFSPEDKAARDWVEAKMRSLGLEVRIDPLGSIYGVRPGRNPDLLPVAFGSHIDTVGRAGIYDGPLGVLAALACVETLNEAGIETDHPLMVVAFSNEEGVRFAPDMMGSLYFCEALNIEEARRILGQDGSLLGDNLDRNGLSGSWESAGQPLAAFVELHIEQGPVLESEGVQIGVVEAVQGLVWTEIKLFGSSNHAGTTPMSMRRDAALTAARIIDGVRALTEEIAGLRATVGNLTLRPNQNNVVAGEASLVVDMRHPQGESLDVARARLAELCARNAANEGVRAEFQTTVEVRPLTFDKGVVEAVEDSATELGLTHMRLTSGACHDAQIIGARYPTAMVFIPSRGGVSHNPEEYSSAEEVEAGANVLLNTILRLAKAAVQAPA